MFRSIFEQREKGSREWRAFNLAAGDKVPMFVSRIDPPQTEAPRVAYEDLRFLIPGRA